MSDVSSAERDVLEEYASRAPARQPATLGDVWTSQWNAAGLGTTMGLLNLGFSAYDDLRKSVEAAGGKSADELATDRGLKPPSRLGQDDAAGVLGQIADSFPEEARKTIDPLRDVRSRAADKAAAIDKEAADVATATYGFTGHATAFVAGVARQAVDPINLGLTIATAPLGGEGALVPFLARQAGIGAAVQLAQEPLIQPLRAELGLESGVKEAAGDVLNAGLGAAGMAGLLRAAGAGARLIRSAVAPKDFAAVGDLAERSETLAKVTADAPAADPMAHAQGIEDGATFAERPAHAAAPPAPEPATIGTPNPRFAEADRMLDEKDMELHFVDHEGNASKISAREMIGAANEDAVAARELVDCIGGGIAEAAE